jgi:hypothetical protein
MQAPPISARRRSTAASRVLTLIGLALAVLLWLGPLSSEATTPVDPEETAVVPCLNKSGSLYKGRISPKQCAHFGPGGTFALGVDLERLVWDDWGKSKVQGAGVECSFDAECSAIPVSVFAFRIRERCGRPVYTRLSARSSFGRTVVRTQGCIGPA